MQPEACGNSPWRQDAALVAGAERVIGLVRTHAPRASGSATRSRRLACGAPRPSRARGEARRAASMRARRGGVFPSRVGFGIDCTSRRGLPRRVRHASSRADDASRRCPCRRFPRVNDAARSHGADRCDPSMHRASSVTRMTCRERFGVRFFAPGWLDPHAGDANLDTLDAVGFSRRVARPSPVLDARDRDDPPRRAASCRTLHSRSTLIR